MVNVGNKTPTPRQAIAQAVVHCNAQLIEQVNAQTLAKGNLVEVARVAGIMAGKQTANLIPLCHPLPLDFVDVDIAVHADRFVITAEVKTHSKTGVEMEALTAATMAALTVYDMGKAVDKAMVIRDVQLIKKTGGKSGDFHRNTET